MTPHEGSIEARLERDKEIARLTHSRGPGPEDRDDGVPSWGRTPTAGPSDSRRMVIRNHVISTHHCPLASGTPLLLIQSDHLRLHGGWSGPLGKSPEPDHSHEGRAFWYGASAEVLDPQEHREVGP